MCEDFACYCFSRFCPGIQYGVTGGAAVVGAKVIVHSVERRLSYEAVTNTAGRYAIHFLLSGTYDITVEKTGFHKFIREGVTLLAGDKPAIDVKLRLGVSGGAPLLQTGTARRSSRIASWKTCLRADRIFTRCGMTSGGRLV